MKNVHTKYLFYVSGRNDFVEMKTSLAAVNNFLSGKFYAGESVCVTDQLATLLRLLLLLCRH